MNLCSFRNYLGLVMVSADLPFSLVTLQQTQACDKRAADTKAGPSFSLRPLHITNLVNSPLLKQKKRVDFFHFSSQRW